MASITKRSYSSWQVAAKDSTLKVKKTFLDKSEALNFAKQLAVDGIAVAKLAKTETLAWQVRVRKKGFPELVGTFTTKAEAEAWSVAREAEMHQRKFVDYREAERHSLGDLMRKYANKVLKGNKANHPDLMRIHKICRHPITQISMHMLQPSDVAAYRDQRLEGGFVEPVNAKKLPLALRTWPPIKSTTVKKEMELISRIISIAMREWCIHLPFNPASGKHCTRPEAQDGDERNRRLEDRTPEILEQIQTGNVQRSRRKVKGLEYILDPEIAALLQAAGGEEINLLRACRYPEWFRPLRKEVTAGSLRSRKLKKIKPKIKARQRKGLRLWAIVSFAIETGMRRGEMLALRWQHLHHTADGAYLLLPAAITKTKTERVVPLNLRAERILKTQPKASELIFNSNYEAVKTAYRRAKEKVQIQDLRMHDLRHEATSRLYENTDLRESEIGAITGHEDDRSRRRYTNIRAAYQVKRFHESRK